MSTSSIGRDAARRLASHLDDMRREIVASVVGSPDLPGPGSYATTVFANGFLDRLRQDLEAEDSESAGSLAGAESHGDEGFEYSRIGAIACAVISAAYVAVHGHSDEVALYLAHRSKELEQRFRVERRSRSVDPVEQLIGDDVVASLLSAIEVRSASNYEHSRAVGMWCSRIARAMGMDPERQAFAALAGKLHDVGKIATPTDILLKPAALTVDEWDTMRAHSRIGAKMLERIPSLKEFAPIVRSHHERVDGSGYPDGLEGEAIPLVARIVAVSDSLHAMISKRPFREALPVPEALDELRGGMGTQFDPAVVEAVLDIVQPSRASRTAMAARTARAGPA